MNQFSRNFVDLVNQKRANEPAELSAARMPETAARKVLRARRPASLPRNLSLESPGLRREFL